MLNSFWPSFGLPTDEDVFHALHRSFPVSGLDKGRCADTDVYKMHDSLDGAKGSVFMVTNVRVLHASYNQVLGNWTTDWEYELRAIEGPPSVEPDGRTYFLVIKPREERRPVY